MHYTTTKLDRRHSWHPYFAWMLRFNKSAIWAGSGVLEFDRARRWFNQTYGWSQDVETQSALKKLQAMRPESLQSDDINPVWAYSVVYNDYRIYLASDRELEWFTLKFPPRC